jgi:hypothetical protein
MCVCKEGEDGWDCTYWVQKCNKKFENKKSIMSSISMDFRWFMHDMPSYPLILFSFFGLGFFGNIHDNYKLWGTALM